MNSIYQNQGINQIVDIRNVMFVVLKLNVDYLDIKKKLMALILEDIK